MMVLCKQGKITEAATKTAGIYYWKNNVNGKGYVGQTLNHRSRIRCYIGGRFKNQTAFYAAVQKYGLENFTCYKVMDCCPSKVALNYWETYWIKELDTFADGGNGYNLTSGGDCNELSEETRKKISNSMCGRKHSDEHRRKNSESNRGRKHSDEHRKKIGDAMRGKKLSEEARKAIGDSQRGRKHSDEHRKKIGDIQRGMKRPGVRKSNLLRTGTLWKEFFVFSLQPTCKRSREMYSSPNMRPVAL